jgi:selenocysteine lyase/cysteine desulfurase
MGLALVYQGFELRPDEEFLVSDHNYYSTLESVRLAAGRTGAQVRRFPIYGDIGKVSADELVDRVSSAVGPATRVVAVTWVHSSTGLKLPIKRIAERLGEVNSDREAGERVLLCVDGVHGFGVEDVEAGKLGCDFFAAGCHKWLFGPRGTGIVWGSKEGWKAVKPTIPTFMDNSPRSAWIAGREPTGRTTGRRMSPGGFKAFEHQWAVAEAFEFHERIGKSNIAARTHELSRCLKDGLAGMPHVVLYTPRPEELSAGIVCFDVKGMTPRTVVERLRRKSIVATTTPYAPSYARLTPSIRNSDAEVEAALREIRALG